MYKTLKIISNYWNLIQEQSPSDMETVDDTGDEPVKNNNDQNKKEIINILKNAFIFDKTKWGPSKQNYIQSRIKLLKRPSTDGNIVNQIYDLVSIINIDPELQLNLESKTLFIFNKYGLLQEQLKDATEPNIDDTTQQPVIDNKEVSSPRTISLKLNEIFPLYNDLIIRALDYKPSEEELIMLDDIISSSEGNPNLVRDGIEKILRSKKEQKDLENDLAEIQSF
jgi:hypothetical protein